LAVGAGAQQVGVVVDEFNDLSAWNDLSTVVSWGGHAGPTSAFEIVDDGGANAVQLTSDAQNHTGWSSDDLWTHTALDLRFGQSIDRNSGTTLRATFRAKYPAGSLSNEGSRFNVFWNHDYPAGGLDMDFNDKYDDDDQEWWARPAYNFRMRPVATHSGAANLLLYGGGHAVEGEYEWKTDNGRWMPGFSSATDGRSPQPDLDSVAGAGLNTYQQGEYGLYQYVITPDEQQFWYDANANGTFETDELYGTQDISAAFDSKGYRQDFDVIQGVRLYWRGSGGKEQIVLDSFDVSASALQGDANEDGKVSLADLSALAGNWGVSDGSANWTMGDFSGEGNVSLADLSALAGNWNADIFAGGAAPGMVPEPTTLLLLAGGGLAGLLRRRR